MNTAFRRREGGREGANRRGDSKKALVERTVPRLPHTLTGKSHKRAQGMAVNGSSVLLLVNFCSLIRARFHWVDSDFHI